MPAFKVMTWNVENLFRPAPGANQPEQKRFQDKITLLASVITNLAPDVVALQEVGGLEPLTDLPAGAWVELSAPGHILVS